MGACSSCLGGARQKQHDVCPPLPRPLVALANIHIPGLALLQSEYSHLLDSDDPYNQSGNSYGTNGSRLAQGRRTQQVMNSEDVKREREALEGITRWTSE